MKSLKLSDVLAWSGIFGGALAWFAAHEIAFYFSEKGCEHRAVLLAVHYVALAACVFFGWVSFALRKDGAEIRDDELKDDENRKVIVPIIATLAAALFSLAIIWQLIAAYVYTGCEK